jgi:hypothetical protein
MSAHNEHSHTSPHGSHGNDHEQVESSVLQPKPILMFLMILFIATAFVFVVVGGLEYGFRKLDETNSGQPATQVTTDARKLPPQPLLQGAPGAGSTATTDVPTLLPLDEMAEVKKKLNYEAENYGWVDKQAGVARIPIERAKQIIAEKGLPSLPSTVISEEVQKAETVRKQVLNAGSSGGQMIGK